MRISLLGGITNFITHFYNFNERAGLILSDIEKTHNTGLVTYFIRLSHFAYIIISFSFFKSYFEDSNLLSTSIALVPPQK
jgi:hypothetical protein